MYKQSRMAAVYRKMKAWSNRYDDLCSHHLLGIKHVKLVLQKHGSDTSKWMKEETVHSWASMIHPPKNNNVNRADCMIFPVRHSQCLEKFDTIRTWAWKIIASHQTPASLCACCQVEKLMDGGFYFLWLQTNSWGHFLDTGHNNLDKDNQAGACVGCRTAL